MNQSNTYRFLFIFMSVSMLAIASGVAADPDSCEGNCGGQAPGGCWCDEQCFDFDDCCDDVCEHCFDEFPEECSPGDCGDPEAGSCCLPNETPACEDAECCELVCSKDPFCCDALWDELCAEAAGSLCDLCPFDVINVPDDYPMIQQAINAAVDGTEIVVAPGTYNEAINFLGKAIHLRSSDGPEETTIDASGLKASVITSENDEGPNTILEGFTISGGAGTPNPFDEMRGGGMFITSSSPTVKNCVFSGNAVDAGGGMYVFEGNPQVIDCLFKANSAENIGGGIMNTDNSNPTITGCHFLDNSAGQSGGGIFNRFDSDPVISDSIFDGNTAVQGGGGMFNNFNSSPAIIDCVFENNTATTGGGIAGSTDSPSSIQDSYFCDNIPDNIAGPWKDLGGNEMCDLDSFHVPGDFPTIQQAINAAVDGMEITVAPGTYNESINFLSKAIHLRSSDGPEKTTIDASGLDNAVVRISGVGLGAILEGFTLTGGTGNEAFDETRGGGAYINEAQPQILNCIFLGNTATLGGGLFNEFYSAPTIVDCQFINNEAENRGGGIFNFLGSSPTIINASFENNSAGNDGGAVYNFNQTEVVFENCSFDGNSAPNGSGTVNAVHDFLRGVGELGDGFWNAATLSPGLGNGPGAASVAGEFKQVPLGDPEFAPFFTGTLLIDLGGTEPGEEHDVIEVEQAAELGGVLNVSLFGDYTPKAGDHFTIMTAAGIESVFDLAVFPSMPDELVMRVIYEQEAGAADSGGGSVTITIDELAVLLGFGDPAEFGFAGLATSVTTGDFDNDGELDIALAFRGETPNDPGSVLVLFNDGGGESFTGQQHPVGAEPSDIVAADLTDNGSLDIAVTNAGDDSVSVLVNDGTGGFGVPVDTTVGTAPGAIAAADFRGIGLIDLAVTNAADDTVSVLHNTRQGDGTFDLVQTVPVGPGPIDLVAAPLLSSTAAGGGAIDLAVANSDADPELGEPAVTLLENQGDGFFNGEQGLIGEGGAVGLNAEDLDNNKDIDLVLTREGSGYVSIYRNLGGGNFTTPLNLSLGGTPQSPTVWDMDGDGLPDMGIVVDDENDGPLVRVIRNDTVPGTGSLAFSFDEDVAVGENPVLVTSGDVTGDGVQDLITVNADDGGALGGAEESSLVVRPNESGVPCPPADLNCDGVVDVLDLLILLEEWGPCADPADCPADLNADGVVDVLDLLILFENWG